MFWAWGIRSKKSFDTFFDRMFFYQTTLLKFFKQFTFFDQMCKLFHFQLFNILYLKKKLVQQLKIERKYCLLSIVIFRFWSVWKWHLICLFVCLSVCLFVCLSVCLSVSIVVNELFSLSGFQKHSPHSSIFFSFLQKYNAFKK